MPIWPLPREGVVTPTDLYVGYSNNNPLRNSFFFCSNLNSPTMIVFPQYAHNCKRKKKLRRVKETLVSTLWPSLRLKRESYGVALYKMYTYDHHHSLTHFLSLYKLSLPKPFFSRFLSLSSNTNVNVMQRARSSGCNGVVGTYMGKK